MAIFNKENKQFDGVDISGATIIAQGTKLKGEIDTECHLHIDGEFDGIINSRNTVVVGRNGVVNGEVYCEKFVVNGKFIGVTRSKIVEIMPYGKIDGKVTSSEFVIERKGILSGESLIEDDNILPL